MAGLALGAAGAAVGAQFGVPGVGWMIGSALGNALFPSDASKPKMHDLKIQSSSFGTMLPIVYGNGSRLAGNLIWAGKPQSKSSSGGKGGSSGNQYDVISLAFAVCQGEIAGFRRIWINGTLYYDVGVTSTPAQVRTANTGGWKPTGGAPSTSAGYGTGAPPSSIFGSGSGSLTSTPAAPAPTPSPAAGGGNYTIFGNGKNALVNTVVLPPLSSGAFTFYYGNGTQTPDGTMQAEIGANCPAYRDTAYVVIQNFSLENYGNAIPNFEFEVASYTTNLSDAISDICNKAGLSSSQYDVSQLTANPTSLDGYMLTGVGPARSALEPLSQTYFFDAVESDTGIKFVPRGGNSGVTFIDGDTAATYETKHEQTVDNVVINRVSETELPREVNVKFYDPGQYLQQGHRYSRRLTVHSQHKINQELPMALSNSHAQWVSDQILYTTWLGRTSFQWSTGPNYLWLEPTDVVTLQKGNESFLVRIIKKDEEQKGKTNWEAVLEDPACYAADPNSSLMPTPITITKVPSTDPGPMNSPLIFEPPLSLTNNNPELWIITSGSQTDWGGCQIYTSYDNSNWVYAGSQQGNQPVGTLTASLPLVADPDSTSTLSVSLTQSLGTLSSVTKSVADAFRNLAYVDGEIISWQNATLTSANNYNITYLRRGVYSSPVASHASGGLFASLNAPFRIPINPGDIGKTVYLRFVPINNRAYAITSVSQATSYSYVFTGTNTQVNAVTNLSVTQSSNLDTATLNVAWTASTSPNIASYTVSYNNGTSWTSLPTVTGTSCQITGLANGSYTIQVVATNAAGVVSAPASTTFTVAPPTVPNVSNLALAGLTSSATTFTGRDVKFTWTDLSTNPNFNDYQVQILDSNSNVLRTEFVRTNSYTYDMARNQQDGGPRRSFTIKVWMRGRQLQLSVTAATLSVTNPQTAALTGTTVTSTINSITVALPAVSDPDWAGYLIYMSTTSGFTPSTATLAYQGTNSTFTVMVGDYATRYIKVSAYDSFGQDSLNFSAQLSSQASTVTQQMIAAGALDITKFASSITPIQIVGALPTSGMTTGQVVFLTTDNKLYRYNGSAWVNSMPFGDLSGSIAAGQIAANTITGGMLNAGAITAREIQSGAITTDKLYVAARGSALNADPACTDVNAWTGGPFYTGATFSIVTGTTYPSGSSAIHCTSPGGGLCSREAIPIDRNKTYRFHYNFWGNPGRTYYSVVYLFDANGNSIAGDGTYWYYPESHATGDSAWHTRDFLFGLGTGKTFPSNAAFVRIGFLFNYDGTGTADQYVQDVRVEEVLPGVLIKDGAITASKITVTTLSSLTANVGTVTAGTVQSADGKTWFDLNNGFITVSDGTRTRGLFGNLGSGAYGLQLWDASGNIFLNAGGITNAPWSAVSGTGKPADNADVTATHTASGIANQGTLATTNSADFATQVGGAAKPANNADVTASHTAAGIANQGTLATQNTVTPALMSPTATGLVANFSQTGVLTGWTAGAGQSIVADPTGSGAQVMQLNANGNQNNTVFSDAFALDPAKTYMVKIAVYKPTADGAAYFGLNFFSDTAGTAEIPGTPFDPNARTFGTATNNPYFWSLTGTTLPWTYITAYIIGCNVPAANVPQGSGVTYWRAPSNARSCHIRMLNFNGSGYGDSTSNENNYWAFPSVTPVDDSATNFSAVTGSTKPANNADVTSANTAAGIANQGSFATMSKIPDSTQGTPSTYIGNLAVGSLQIQGNAVSTYLSFNNIPNVTTNAPANTTRNGVIYVTPTAISTANGAVNLINVMFEVASSYALVNQYVEVYRSTNSTGSITSGDLLVEQSYAYNGGLSPEIMITHDPNTTGSTGNFYYKVVMWFDNNTSSAQSVTTGNFVLHAFYLLK